MIIKKIFIIQIFIFGLFLIPFHSTGSKPQKIKVSELRDKIAAEWIGQMIGNMYGLPHENKYIAEPGPEKWPYGYSKSPVSYTHLDVYKRQHTAWGWQCRSARPRA